MIDKQQMSLWISGLCAAAQRKKHALNQPCVLLWPLRAHSVNTRHPEPRRASPRPASRHASAASLTAVTDDQQFEEVIVVAGHAGGGRLKPRGFAAASRLSPAERLAGTRLTCRPDESGQFQPGRCRKQRVCRWASAVSAVARSLPETAFPPAAQSGEQPIRARRRHMTWQPSTSPRRDTKDQRMHVFAQCGSMASSAFNYLKNHKIDQIG